MHIPSRVPPRACAGNGRREPIPYLAASLRGLFATDAVPGLRVLLHQQPEQQQPLAELAAHALSLPEAERAALAADAEASGTARDLAQMLAADCFTPARRRHQAAAPAPCLAEAVASLAAQPQLWERRGQTEQAELLTACLELLFALAADPLLAAQQAGRQARASPRLLLALGGPGGLPLLCRLAAEVAAAAPAASSGPARAGSAAGRQGGPAGVAGADADFGRLCWEPSGDVGGEWATTQHRVVILVGQVG